MQAKGVHHSAQREGGPVVRDAGEGWTTTQILHRRRLRRISENARPGLPVVELTPVCETFRTAAVLHLGLATMAMPKRFVYILKNTSHPPRYYTGLTSDVHSRLAAHNEGRCQHTARRRPWHLDIVIEFSNESRAVAFEKYLKSGSGSAFAMRHFRDAGTP
jgi:putative endonuclease